MNLIHLVYNFLWGDLVTLPPARRKLSGAFAAGSASGPGGNLFYDPDPGTSLPTIPGNAPGLHRKAQSRSTKTGSRGFRPDRLHGHRVGMGNLIGVVAAISAGGPGAVFWMWMMALLGLLHRFRGGHAGPDLQAAGSPLRRASGAARPIIFTPCS